MSWKLFAISHPHLFSAATVVIQCKRGGWYLFESTIKGKGRQEAIQRQRSIYVDKSHLNDFDNTLRPRRAVFIFTFLFFFSYKRNPFQFRGIRVSFRTSNYWCRVAQYVSLGDNVENCRCQTFFKCCYTKREFDV